MSGANTAVRAAAVASTIPMSAAATLPSISPRDASARMEIGVHVHERLERRGQRFIAPSYPADGASLRPMSSVVAIGLTY